MVKTKTVPVIQYQEEYEEVRVNYAYQIDEETQYIGFAEAFIQRAEADKFIEEHRRQGCFWFSIDVLDEFWQYADDGSWYLVYSNWVPIWEESV